MSRLPFVGRQEELRQLRAVLDQAASGAGGIVLVEGPEGVGKSWMLGELQRLATEDPGLAESVFATARCFADSQTESLAPFKLLLQQLARDSSNAKRTAAFMKAIRDFAPDWLALMAAPTGAGALVGMTAKTAAAAGSYLLSGAAGAVASQGMVDQYVATMDRLLRSAAPIVLVMEDVQWIDRASSELLVSLVERTKDKRIVIVLTCRQGDFDRGNPTGNLRLELENRRAVEHIVLAELDTSEVKTYLLQRFSTTFGEAFPKWLHHLCRGNPFFVAQYLSLLEDQRVIAKTDAGFALDGDLERVGDRWVVTGRLAEIPIPPSVKSVLDARIHALEREERELLEIGAVQGELFDSLIVSDVSQRNHDTVLRAMRLVTESSHIIKPATGDEWERERSETYAFEHELMHRAFYDSFQPFERRLRHAAVGKALRAVAAGLESPPRKLLIDVAYHAKEAGEHSIAAEFALGAARESQAAGASVEASHLAREAIDALRRITARTADQDLLLGEAVLVTLVSAVYGADEDPAAPDMIGLARDGEEAAGRASDRSLVAQIAAVTGQFLVQAGKVPQALTTMRRALDLAMEIGEPLTEFFVMNQLSTQLGKEDLSASLRLRYDTLAAFDRVAVDDLPKAQRDLIRRDHADLLVHIGVGEFDSGDFETALAWLERGHRALEAEHALDAIPAALNYVAQTFCALGRFDDAIARLEESLVLLETAHGSASGSWRGYNLALLAKVHLEAGQLALAAPAIKEGVRLSERYPHTDLLTIVRNYQGEILMSAEYPGHDMREAERVLRANYDDAVESELPRAFTPAASLLGQVLLECGALDEAMTFSSKAVDEITRRGHMPAVRTEEILYNHGVVLSACGKPDEARTFFDRAWAVVNEKLQRLTDPANRESFIEHVRLSRAIASAAVSPEAVDLAP